VPSLQILYDYLFFLSRFSKTNEVSLFLEQDVDSIQFHVIRDDSLQARLCLEDVLEHWFGQNERIFASQLQIVIVVQTKYVDERIASVLVQTFVVKIEFAHYFESLPDHLL